MYTYAYIKKIYLCIYAAIPAPSRRRAMLRGGPRARSYRRVRPRRRRPKPEAIEGGVAKRFYSDPGLKVRHLRRTVKSSLAGVRPVSTEVASFDRDLLIGIF